MSGIFEKHLILSDYDGTFSGSYGEVARNIEAIKYFKANGGHFTFSTGRLPSVLSRIYPDFKKVANAPVVMGNGAVIYDAENDTVLKKDMLRAELGRDIVENALGRFPDMTLVLYPESGEMITSPNASQMSGDNWIKFRLDSDDRDKVIACRDFIREKYGDKINCFRSWYTLVEVVSKTAKKSNAISFFKEYYRERGIPDLTVSCIGDFENDINMLEKADISFCPDNAIDEIKKISRHTVCNCNDGAVADMIDILKTYK